MKRVRVVASGLVQGVYFRDATRRLALRYGVSGWVRNNWDGTVEAVFEGEPEAVDRLVEFCHHGPRGAAVEGVNASDEPPEGLRGFEVR